jgi:hypothetical protein
MAEEPKADMKSKAVDWLLGQPFNNVLLVAILGSLAYGMYYSITVAVPAHLQMIQQGYKEMEQSHKDERRETMQMYDRWVNRGPTGASPASVASQE